MILSSIEEEMKGTRGEVKEGKMCTAKKRKVNKRDGRWRKGKRKNNKNSEWWEMDGKHGEKDGEKEGKRKDWKGKMRNRET